MAEREVRIPDIGDAEGVEVVEVLVSVGDRVDADAPLIVIESDKASMEIPAPAAGKVRRIEVGVGDAVSEGQLIVVLDAESERTVDRPADAKRDGRAEPKEAKAAPKEAKAETKDAKGAPNQAKTEPKPEREGEARRAPAESRTAQGQPDRPDTSAPTTSRRLEVRVPDIGDAKDVSVVEVAVKSGDSVQANDLLAVLESDKASMEVPAPAEGKVTEVAVREGDAVGEGSLLVVIESRAEAPASSPSESKPSRQESAVDETAPRAKSAPAARAPARAEPAPRPSAKAPAPTKADDAVYAGPAVRRLARELGVDLRRVTGTGPRQRIVKDDVQAFVKRALTEGAAATGATGIPQVPEIDFTKFGDVEVVALSRIRARGATNLQRSWLNVVHVTQHDEADVTSLEEFRASLKGEAESKGVRLTPLPFLMKACVYALREFPSFNASLDRELKNLVLKRYYHIGFATDTNEGLVVPVVRDVDRKGVMDLANEIAELSERARAAKLRPDDLQGASFTVSSLGAIGGTGFTPIVNAPEVAILGVSRVTTKPQWNGSAFEPRKMLPLSLSYDHRAINGAEAGRFMVFLCDSIRDLRRVLL